MGLSVLDWDCACCKGQFNPATPRVGLGNGYQYKRVDGAYPVCIHCQKHRLDCLSMTEKAAASAYELSSLLWKGGIENKMFPHAGGPIIAIGRHSGLDYGTWIKQNLPDVLLVRKRERWFAEFDGKEYRLADDDPSAFVKALVLVGQKEE